MIQSDKDLLKLYEEGRPVVTPFLKSKHRFQSGVPALSYGLDSMGYDIRMSEETFKIFNPKPGVILDPKDFDSDFLKEQELMVEQVNLDNGLVGENRYFILPRNTYALCVSQEKFDIPEDTRVLFVGKSTYARCGVVANVTPGEPGWKGYLTIELTNTSPCDVRIYAGEGVLSCIFLKGDGCNTPYGDGKYQNQTKMVTEAKA